MFAALLAFFLGTTVQGDGPFRPNDVVHKNFFTTTIERGPVETHSCNSYKAVEHAKHKTPLLPFINELAPESDPNQMYIHVECK